MSQYEKYKHLDEETKTLIGLGFLEYLKTQTRFANRLDFWELLREAQAEFLPVDQVEGQTLTGDELLKCLDLFVAMISAPRQRREKSAS